MSQLVECLPTMALGPGRPSTVETGHGDAGTIISAFTRCKQEDQNFKASLFSRVGSRVSVGYVRLCLKDNDTNKESKGEDDVSKIHVF